MVVDYRESLRGREKEGGEENASPLHTQKVVVRARKKLMPKMLATTNRKKLIPKLCAVSDFGGLVWCFLG